MLTCFYLSLSPVQDIVLKLSPTMLVDKNIAKKSIDRTSNVRGLTFDTSADGATVSFESSFSVAYTQDEQEQL